MKEKVKSPDHYRKIILSNIKHDLTNPINAILGYSEFIIDIAQNGESEQFNRDIHSIHDCGNVILEHINKIYSKIVAKIDYNLLNFNYEYLNFN